MNDLLQYMFQDGFLTAAEVTALRKTCRELHESPVRVLRSLNIAHPEEIQDYIQRTYRVPVVTDKLVEALDEGYKALVPVDIAINYGVFAIAEEGEKLFVAMEDPSDHGLIHKLEFFLNRRVIPATANVFQIASALTRLYEVGVEQMRLTTLIESSRGVVGGARAHSQEALPESSFDNADESDAAHPKTNDFDNDDAAVESLTARALEITETPAAALEITETPAAALESDDSFMNSAQALDEASPGPLDAPPPASRRPDLNVGEMVFFESDDASKPANGLTKDTEVLFEETTQPPETTDRDMEPGEMAFFDAPAEPAATPMQDLSPGDMTFFDAPSEPATAPMSDLGPGDMAFFDSPSPAAEVTQTPTKDLAPEEVALFDSKEPLAANTEGANLSPGEIVLFDDEPSHLVAGDAVLFDNSAHAPETTGQEDVLNLEESSDQPNASLAELGLPTIKTSGTAPEVRLDLNPGDDVFFDEQPHSETMAPLAELQDEVADPGVETSDESNVEVDDLLLENETPAETPIVDTKALMAQCNSILVKISISPNRGHAVNIINAKLASHGVTFALDANGLVTCLVADAPAERSVIEALQPLLKRLERLSL